MVASKNTWSVEESRTDQPHNSISARMAKSIPIALVSFGLLALFASLLKGFDQYLLSVRLAWLASLILGIQWIGFLLSRLFNTDKLFDFFGTGSFMLVAWISFSRSRKDQRQILATSLVCVWAIRLCIFLVWRVWRQGCDKRLDCVKDKVIVFWLYWTMQAIWAWTTLLPLSILNICNPALDDIIISDVLGVSLWVVGFVIEVVADAQKAIFRSKEENKDSFIQSGLWTWCRHPNYFGEIVLWIGVFIICSEPLEAFERMLSIISPIFVWLLLSHVSGVPILEQAGQEKWGKRYDYRNYLRRFTPFTAPVQD